MKQEHFPQHVAALMKSPLLILDHITTEKIALMHAGIGLAGETFELNEVLLAITKEKEKEIDHSANLVEELGDLLFYITDIENILCGIGYEVVRQHTEWEDNHPLDDMAAINKTVDQIVNLIKAVFAYNAQLSSHYKGDDYTIAVRLCVLVAELYNRIENVSQSIDVGMDKIREHNYNKLKVRYPEGYTDLAAAERADKTLPTTEGSNIHGIGPDTAPED